MKLFNLILATVSILLISCNAKGFDEKLIKSDNQNLEVTITEVGKYKYSKVYGYVTYNGIKYYVDNGNTGYYYKEYNLSKGEKISSDIKFYYLREDNGDVRITTSDLDVSNYERRN